MLKRFEKEKEITSLNDFENLIDRRFIPHRALLELTHVCNFRCVHCYLSDHRPSGELSAGEWLEVIDKLKKAGVLYLTFSGGEFLLRRDHAEICMYARKNGFIIRLFTNASLITEDVVGLWNEKIHPVAVETTLYGASTESYRKICGNEKGYEKTMRGLKLLAQAEIKTLLKILVLRDNISEVDDMIDIAKKFGFEYQVSGRLTPCENGSREPLNYRLPDEDRVEFNKNYEAIHFHFPKDPEAKPCNGGRTSLAVAPNGDVYPCVELRKPVGNLVKQSLDDFWHDHPLLLEMRKIRNKDFCFPEKMDTTKAMPLCMAYNLMTTGSLIKVGNPL